MHCLSAQVNQFLAAHDLRPELTVRGAQLGTIARMVAAGMGVSLVPQMMIETELVTGCVALPFTPPAPMREFNLVRNPLRFESKAAAAFHQETAAAFSSQINAR
jgi:LysR family hydrogen peroxide-inducible transcriptional activator